MAAVPLFRDTNMAAVTSCENTLYSQIRVLKSKCKNGSENKEIIFCLSMQIMANELSTFASLKSFGSFMNAIFIPIHTEQLHFTS